MRSSRILSGAPRVVWAAILYRLLTLTASSGRPGEWVAVVDHLTELLSSWEADRRTLHRSLDDSLRWEYLMVVEPHESGYAHAHIAVFVDGEVSGETFEPVIDAHLRNCELAERGAHEYENVITVKRLSGERSGTWDHTLGNTWGSTKGTRWRRLSTYKRLTRCCGRQAISGGGRRTARSDT